MNFSDIISVILEWMTPLEIFATIFTLLCVWFTVKRNIWCWPFGIVGVSAYFFVFYQNKLYADAGLQIVFLIQSIYGWYFWVYGKAEDIDNVPIRKLLPKEQLLTLLTIGVLTFTVGWLSSTFTDTDVAYLDALVASISLIANLLLARKVIDNWPLWMFVDVFYVGLFIYKELYLTAGLYVVFFFMATTGLIQWRKEWLAQEA
jgi:nicotinamide mononucleotide transporter